MNILVSVEHCFENLNIKINTSIYVSQFYFVLRLIYSTMTTTVDEEITKLLDDICTTLRSTHYIDKWLRVDDLYTMFQIGSVNVLTYRVFARFVKKVCIKFDDLINTTNTITLKNKQRKRIQFIMVTSNPIVCNESVNF